MEHSYPRRLHFLLLSLCAGKHITALEMGNLRPMVPKGKLYLSDHKTVRLLYLCDRVPGGWSQQCQILFQQWRRTPFHFQQLQALMPQLTISFEHFQFLKVWKNTTSVVFLRMVSFPALIDSLALRDMRWESNFFVVPHNWNTLECNDWTYISLTSANSKYYLTRLYYFFFLMVILLALFFSWRN